MKVIDSGMPEEAYWNSLFDIPRILEWLDIKGIADPVVEIGCGYGTFTVPVAQVATIEIVTFDIEPAMIAAAQINVQKAGLSNVKFFLRDVVEHGTGLESSSVGMVFLFNILHFKERRTLFEEASRILRPGGIVAIIHWRKDVQTPRGPSIESRPDEEMILNSIGGLDLALSGRTTILEPYHWGMKLIKGKAK